MPNLITTSNIRSYINISEDKYKKITDAVVQQGASLSQLLSQSVNTDTDVKNAKLAQKVAQNLGRSYDSQLHTTRANTLVSGRNNSSSPSLEQPSASFQAQDTSEIEAPSDNSVNSPQTYPQNESSLQEIQEVFKEQATVMGRLGYTFNDKALTNTETEFNNADAAADKRFEGAKKKFAIKITGGVLSTALQASTTAMSFKYKPQSVPKDDLEGARNTKENIKTTKQSRAGESQTVEETSNSVQEKNTEGTRKKGTKRVFSDEQRENVADEDKTNKKQKLEKEKINQDTEANLKNKAEDDKKNQASKLSSEDEAKAGARAAQKENLNKFKVDALHSISGIGQGIGRTIDAGGDFSAEGDNAEAAKLDAEKQKQETFKQSATNSGQTFTDYSNKSNQQLADINQKHDDIVKTMR
jgi:hypothetical protein